MTSKSYFFPEKLVFIVRPCDPRRTFAGWKSKVNGTFVFNPLVAEAGT
jgi:hypothetical protein